MEARETDFVAAKQKQKKKKRIRRAVAWALVALLLVGAVWFLLKQMASDAASVSVSSYQVSAVSEGEINSVISGSGTLSARTSDTVTAPAKATVAEVLKQTGDKAAAGETILILSSDDLQDQLDTLNDELDTLRQTLATVTQTRSLAITAPVKGVVKDVRAQAGDLAEDLPYLCILSTDGRMKLTVDASDAISLYAAVRVTVDGSTYDGVVRKVENGKAEIVIPTNKYAIGTAAEVTDAGGNRIASGTLDVNEFVYVTAGTGRIDTVLAKENMSAAKGRTLFKLGSGALSDDYISYKKQEQDLIDDIAELEDSLTVKAEYDCVLTTIPVAAGDEVASGETLCTMAGTDGFTMTLSIDELDIASVKHGQSVKVTLDALEGEYTGVVSNISYAGSGSYVTSYTATVTTDPIENAYPGMSASVEIVTDTSGKSLLVQSGALQYEGKQAYLYLAGDGVSFGDSVPADSVDLSAMTRVDVTTGMSNGNYVVVTGEGLAAGDLIWMTKLTTTATYQASSQTSATFTMGGMSGSMPSGGMSGAMPSGGFGGGDVPGGYTGSGRTSGRTSGSTSGSRSGN